MHIEETHEEQHIILNPYTKPNLVLIIPIFTVSPSTTWSHFQDLKRNWVIPPNDWKRKIRKETFQKSLFKIFCFINNVTRKIKALQNLSNKEMHVTLQSDKT